MPYADTSLSHGVKQNTQCTFDCRHLSSGRQRKVAVKLHMVANVANMLPRFAVVGKASEHDSRREEELFASLLPGDVGVLDRAYNNFPVLYRQTLRGVFFVIREKEPTKYRVVKRITRKNLPKGIISDETIRLTGTTTKADYPRTLRRVKALVEVKGEMREMVFCTNNFEWSASTVAGLYRARWAVELLFKELKQTLQLQSRNNLVNKTLLKHFLSLHSRYGIHSPHHNLPHCSPGFWP